MSKVTEKKHDSGPAPYARYLVIYNQFSASLWTMVFFNTILLSVFLGQPRLFDATKNITTLVQTLALVEVYNSAAGIVKSPVLTTVSQVASRLLIVWGVFQILPNSPGNTHWTYITCSLAWSITEIIRYFYYAQNILTNGNPPRYLTLLRYNSFIILYPIGVASELTLIHFALDEAASVVGTWYKVLFVIVTVIYAPGFYMLYTYMFKQRKKIMRSLYPTDEKKTK